LLVLAVPTCMRDHMLKPVNMMS